MGIADFLRRLLPGRRPRRGSSNPSPGGPPQNTRARRVTYPDPEPSRSPGAKVVLTFQDGTQLAIPEGDPRVKEFVKTADRMMRPSRWRRLIKPGRL